MELVDITDQVEPLPAAHGVAEGAVVLYNPHTTAGLTINEGADPAVRQDLVAALRRMLPQGIRYAHLEGNSPSHLLATLTGSSVTVPVSSGRLLLGTWQRIFFCEYDGPRSRTVRYLVQGAGS